MQTTATSLFARDDTFLGVCQAIGDDLGFNPLWLRLAIAVGLLWNPTVVVATYAALAVVVLASRLVFPAPKAAAEADAPAVEKAQPELEELPFEYAKAA